MLSGDKKIARSGLYQIFQMPKVEVGQTNMSKHGWIDRSNQQYVMRIELKYAMPIFLIHDD